MENAEWCTNAFDRFVVHAIEQKGLQVSKRATPHQLVRRLYLDLTGLSPSYKAVVWFGANPSVAEHEALVDRKSVASLTVPHGFELCKWSSTM